MHGSFTTQNSTQGAHSSVVGLLLVHEDDVLQHRLRACTAVCFTTQNSTQGCAQQCCFLQHRLHAARSARRAAVQGAHGSCASVHTARVAGSCAAPCAALAGPCEPKHARVMAPLPTPRMQPCPAVLLQHQRSATTLPGCALVLRDALRTWLHAWGGAEATRSHAAAERAHAPHSPC